MAITRRISCFNKIHELDVCPPISLKNSEAMDGRLRPSTQFFEPPLMASRVGAGLPRGVLEAPVTGLTIDAHLVTRASHALLLIVKGASMIEAGLMPGETLIAEKSSSTQDQFTTLHPYLTGALSVGVEKRAAQAIAARIYENYKAAHGDKLT